MAEVTIYGFPQSTFVRTARLACEEKGVAYDIEPVEFGSEDHLAVQPFGKIPGFRHGGTTLWETLAICAYVDETFDGPALQPSDSLGRAYMFEWISAQNDYGYKALIHGLVFPRIVAPSRGEEPDEDLIAENLPAIERFLKVADGALGERTFFAGNAVSIADLFVLPCLFYTSITPEGQERLPRHENLGRWLATMQARPSFAATQPPMPERAAAE